MKKLAEPIPLKEPLRDVRWRTGALLESESIVAERLQARYEQGLREGEKALREQLLAQRNELLELQQGVFHSMLHCLPQLQQDCEQDLIALALEVAQKIVAGLPISAEMIEAAVREALAHCEATQELTVLLHAEDLALLQRVNAPVLVTTLAGEKLRFQASPEVTRGGCLVQTRFGVLDARRETKFDLLKKSLQS
jgi:flagellar assembly protein FliH